MARYLCGLDCWAASTAGQGLGAVVTLAAAHGIRERGDQAMLHVRAGNAVADRLYRRIGFEVRRRVTVAVLRRDLTSSGFPNPAS